MFNQKFILIFLGIFVLISFSFLAISENRQHNIKDGWFLYFNNIQDQSLDFTIENYSNNSTFTWEIFIDENSVAKNSIQVLKESRENVRINKPLTGGQIKIIVYQAKEFKEIYKTFDK